MKVTLQILPEKTIRQVNIRKGCTVEDVLRSCAFLPDAYIVMKGAVPLPLDAVLDASQELTAVRVASGG